MTWSPIRFVTGTGSPVNIDSSIELEPSVIIPSTGTFSPAALSVNLQHGHGKVEYLPLYHLY